jgi:hypothetical protein
MDSDDEEEQMFAEIFEEEMAAAAQDEEHIRLHRHGRVFRPPKVHSGYADAGIWSSW